MSFDPAKFDHAKFDTRKQEKKVETRIMGNATFWTVNGLSARKLKLTYDLDCFTVMATSFTGTHMRIGIRVYKRTSDGVETEITSGIPVAIVTDPPVWSSCADVSNAAHTATWNCPVTTLNPTDSIVVRVCWSKFEFDVWSDWSSDWEGGSGTFSTEQLGALDLCGVVWTVHYAAYFSYGGGLYFDAGKSDTCCSRIENFTWTPVAPPPPAYIPVMKFHQKGTTTIYTSG